MRASVIRADRQIVKMPFQWEGTLGTTSTAGIKPQFVKTFRLNSIYDPELTVAPGQVSAAGFDQWNQFYSKYRVFATTYTITMVGMNADQVNKVAWRCGNDIANLPLEDTDFVQPHTRRALVGNREGMSKVTLSGTLPLPKFLGQTPTQFKSSEDLSSVFLNNPVETIYGNLIAEGLNEGTSNDVWVTVRLTYHVELFDAVEILPAFSSIHSRPLAVEPLHE